MRFSDWFWTEGVFPWRRPIKGRSYKYTSLPRVGFRFISLNWLLGRAQPVIPPNLYSVMLCYSIMLINIIAWGPQVTVKGDWESASENTSIQVGSNCHVGALLEKISNFLTVKWFSTLVRISFYWKPESPHSHVSTRTAWRACFTTATERALVRANRKVLFLLLLERAPCR